MCASGGANLKTYIFLWKTSESNRNEKETKLLPYFISYLFMIYKFI